MYFYGTVPHRSLVLNLRLQPGLSGSYPYTVNHAVQCVRVLVRGEAVDRYDRADLHVLPERVCGPVLPVITWAASSPGTPA